MEPILFIGGIIVLLGGVWTAVDLLADSGVVSEAERRRAAQSVIHACSGFRSRDISSKTACRAGLSS